MAEGVIYLTKSEGFYYLLVHNSREETYKFKFCFPFPPKTQQEALEKAQSFGKEMSQKNSIPLEEKLSPPV